MDVAVRTVLVEEKVRLPLVMTTTTVVCATRSVVGWEAVSIVTLVEASRDVVESEGELSALLVAAWVSVDGLDVTASEIEVDSGVVEVGAAEGEEVSVSGAGSADDVVGAAESAAESDVDSGTESDVVGGAAGVEEFDGGSCRGFRS